MIQKNNSIEYVIEHRAYSNVEAICRIIFTLLLAIAMFVIGSITKPTSVAFSGFLFLGQIFILFASIIYSTKTVLIFSKRLLIIEGVLPWFGDISLGKSRIIAIDNITDVYFEKCRQVTRYGSTIYYSIRASLYDGKIPFFVLIPIVFKEEQAKALVNNIKECITKIKQAELIILPKGYVYSTDALSTPHFFSRNLNISILVLLIFILFLGIDATAYYFLLKINIGSKNQ